MTDNLRAGTKTVGRFGWKAQVPTLFQFAGDALVNEMGITTPDFPNENCPQGNCAELAFNPAPGLNDNGNMPASLTNFMAMLAAPARGPQNADTAAGEQLFNAIGCTSCHVATLTTGSNAIAALDHKSYHPYSDFLLHDMGTLGEDSRGRRDRQRDAHRTAVGPALPQPLPARRARDDAATGDRGARRPGQRVARRLRRTRRRCESESARVPAVALTSRNARAQLRYASACARRQPSHSLSLHSSRSRRCTPQRRNRPQAADRTAFRVSVYADVDTPPDNIPYDRIDGLVLAFLNPVDDCRGFTTTDFPAVREIVRRARKQSASGRKILVTFSIGGGDATSTNQLLESIASRAECRKQFADQVAAILTQNDLDGVNIDWEFPKSTSLDNYTLFIKALRESVGAKIITIAIYDDAGKEDASCRLTPNVFPYVDYYLVMAYLAPRNDAIQRWIKPPWNLPASKLRLGLALFGNADNGGSASPTNNSSAPFRRRAQTHAATASASTRSMACGRRASSRDSR